MTQTTHDTVRDMTEKGLDSAEEKVLDGLDAARKAAENAAEHTAELQGKAEDAVKEISRSLSAYVQEKPLQAAGIAFAAGVVTTWLLSRR